MRVLAVDVGGTKTAVAIASVEERSLSILREGVYRSGDYPGLPQILEDFLAKDRQRPRFAGVGVAGPVRGGRARITKLPWSADEKELSRRFRPAVFRIVNDFVANALGLPYLKPRQVRELARGKPEKGGPIALLGAGTGLGEAGLAFVGGRYQPLPSEGGHKDFAPRNDREDRLAAFLRGKTGRAEWDRVLAGEGLRHIYDFLVSDGGAESPEVARELSESED